MYNRILVPTDGSDVAETAAKTAIGLAQQFDATLHVIHILELGSLPPGFEDEAASELAHRGEQATQSLAELATEADVDVTARVIEDGLPTHRAILAYAEKHDIDCIVVGTHGRNGFDRFVIGSVAEQTLRESPVPVVTVHEETVVDHPFETILVPTDGSDCAQAAAAHAIELAEATGAALHVIHVVDLGVFWDEACPGSVLEALEEAGKEGLEQIIDQANAAEISTIQSSVLNGTPYDVIVEYAEDHGVDCIVLGTHGRTGWRRQLLGSVTERVIRLTDVPVIGIKDPEEVDEE
jgi:nucleotide-binding universal stress UspA family protein